MKNQIRIIIIKHIIIYSKEVKAHIKIIINFTINKVIVIKGNLYRYINRCF